MVSANTAAVCGPKTTRNSRDPAALPPLRVEAGYGTIVAVLMKSNRGNFSFA